jgi:hypothetical protein
VDCRVLTTVLSEISSSGRSRSISTVTKEGAAVLTVVPPPPSLAGSPMSEPLFSLPNSSVGISTWYIRPIRRPTR